MKNKKDGKLSIHCNGDSTTAELWFRMIIFRQLSVLSIQGWSCRPVARCVDPLPDGMVDLIFDPMHTRRFLFDSLSFEIQVEQYSTILMRSLCVSSVFTVM